MTLPLASPSYPSGPATPAALTPAVSVVAYLSSMRVSSSPLALSGPKTSIILDYGADSQSCDAELEISQHGMHFTCRWQFEVGTHLGFSLTYPGSLASFQISGFVVESTKLCRESYRIGFLFDEITAEQRRGLEEIALSMGAKARSQEVKDLNRDPRRSRREQAD